MTVGNRHEPTVHEVIIALGTNTWHAANMLKAMTLLEDVMSGMKYSKELWTEPIGMTSGMFLNKLAKGYCRLEIEELHRRMKDIEHKCGRSEEEKRNGIVKIDIDILKYDDTICHAEDWKREYIKTLMKEL